MAAKLEPIQKMETESEVLVTGEGGKITTITQVQKLLKKSTDQSCAIFFFHLIMIIIKKFNIYNQAQLAGAVPVPGAPPLPLILANQIQGGDIMRQVYKES